MGLKRLFLHAHSLHFTLPDSEQPVNVEAALTEDLETILNKLANDM